MDQTYLEYVLDRIEELERMICTAAEVGPSCNCLDCAEADRVEREQESWAERFNEAALMFPDDPYGFMVR